MDDAREPLLIFPNNDSPLLDNTNRDRNKLSASVDNAASSKLIHTNHQTIKKSES